jgi:8-oxo-dGTP pyrophosphatase MutT (NUDIX family)
LLVFVHRDVSLLETGVQVPAGTCRAGEPPADAVLRETCEETGYSCFEVRRPLGIATYDVGRETHVRHFFELAPTAALPPTWEAAEEHDGLRPPTPLTFLWIPVAHGHVLAAGLGARLSALG